MSSEPLELRAGPLLLELEGPDLRGIGPAGEPLVQRVYPAFRDGEWRTAPVLVSDRQVERGEESFQIALEGSARLGGLDLGWMLRAQGREDGTVSCRLEVEPRAEFETRRLGLCVHLDAAACAGARALASGPDGEEERALADQIAPQPVNGESSEPILGPFTALALEFANGARLTLDTAGTRFELEDQRNWADSTLKVYSSGPPQALRVRPGERFEQEVRLDFAPPRRPRPPRPSQAAVVGDCGPLSVPPIGISLAGEWTVPEELRPAHLRVDVGREEQPPIESERLARALARSGAALELAVHGSAEEPPDLPAELAAAPLARVLALERDERSTSPELARLVRGAVGAEVPLALGSSAHFSEVCRRPPVSARGELVCWSAHPQVHATDERSVIENLPGLGAQVRTARALLPQLGPVVSALSIGPADRPDPRAASPFGSAWTVGALAQLLDAGVASLTLAGGPGQEAILAVAAVLMAARGAPLRTVVDLDPAFAALAWGEQALDGVLANLTPVDRRCSLQVPGRETLALALGPYEWLRLSTRV